MEEALHYEEQRQRAVDAAANAYSAIDADSDEERERAEEIDERIEGS